MDIATAGTQSPKKTAIGLVSPSGEITALTSLRGIAAVGVLLLHLRDQFGPFLNPDRVTLFFARSYLFVDFFFVLSGFVISLSYGALFDARISPGNYRAFIIKRLARIYPLHILVLMGFVASEAAKYLVATSANLPFSVNSWPALVANIFLVQAWGLFDHYTWNHPAWSISTEWFAYILFPFLALWVLRLRSFAALLGVAMLCFAVLEVFFRIPDDISFSYFLLRCVPSFVLGMIVYRLTLLLPRHVASLFAKDAVFGAVLFASALSIALTVPSLVAVFIFFLVVLCGSLNRGVVAAGLSWRPFYFLGMISYSIYLVHTLVLRVWQMLFQVVWHSRIGNGQAIAAFIALLAVVLIASTVSYYYIENPGRRYFGRFAGGKRAKG